VTPKREFLDYIADIQEASQNITQFIAGMTLAQFAQDQKTIYAGVRAFEIIGEAAKKIPPSVRKRHTKVHGRKWSGCGTSSFMSTSESTTRSCGKQLEEIHYTTSAWTLRADSPVSVIFSNEPMVFNLSLLKEAKMARDKMNMDVRLDAEENLIETVLNDPVSPAAGGFNGEGIPC
jgi:hypothetical protein